MIFVLPFLVPDAIVSAPKEVDYKETVERITAESARAIAGRSVPVRKPRDFRSLAWLSDMLEFSKQISNASGFLKMLGKLSPGS